MKRISSTDWLVFIIVAIFLVDLDFESMSTIKWVGFTVSMLWLVLFILKHVIKKK